MDDKIDFETLTSFIPFNTLSDEYLDKVVEQAKLNSYQQGALIFRRGKPLSDTFYLVDGNIDLIDSQYVAKSINRSDEKRQYPLNQTCPSPVSAVAKSDTQILTVGRDFVDLVMAWSESGEGEPTASEQLDFNSASMTSYGNANEENGDDNDWMSCLLQSPLFTQIPPANIQKLFTRFETINAAKGDTIVREGEPGDYFYVIESGSAMVRDKNNKINVSLSVGHYFGEEALVGDTMRNASVTMKEPGSLMRLSKEDFKSLLSSPLLNRVSMDEIRKQSRFGARIQLLDVRLPVEYRSLHVPECQNLPLSSLRDKISMLDRKTIYIVADDAGRRCDVATHLLCQEGFDAYILADSHQYY